MAQLPIGHIPGGGLAPGAQQGVVVITAAAQQRRRLLQGQEASFEFGYIGDRKGVFYYLGSDEGTQNWSNPGDCVHGHTPGEAPAAVLASSIGEGDPQMVTHADTHTRGFRTASLPGVPGAVTVKIQNFEVCPNVYVFTSCETSGGVWAAETWALLGSTDGVSYVDLDVRVSVSSEMLSRAFMVSTHENYYRFLRLQLGANGSSAADNSLGINAFEVYGTLRALGDAAFASRRIMAVQSNAVGTGVLCDAPRGAVQRRIDELYTAAVDGNERQQQQLVAVERARRQELLQERQAHEAETQRAAAAAAQDAGRMSALRRDVAGLQGRLQDTERREAAAVLRADEAQGRAQLLVGAADGFSDLHERHANAQMQRAQTEMRACQRAQAGTAELQQELRAARAELAALRERGERPELDGQKVPRCPQEPDPAASPQRPAPPREAAAQMSSAPGRALQPSQLTKAGTVPLLGSVFPAHPAPPPPVAEAAQLPPAEPLAAAHAEPAQPLATEEVGAQEEAKAVDEPATGKAAEAEMPEEPAEEEEHKTEVPKRAEEPKKAEEPVKLEEPKEEAEKPEEEEKLAWDEQKMQVDQGSAELSPHVVQTRAAALERLLGPSSEAVDASQGRSVRVGNLAADFAAIGEDLKADDWQIQLHALTRIRGLMRGGAASPSDRFSELFLVHIAAPLAAAVGSGRSMVVQEACDTVILCCAVTQCTVWAQLVAHFLPKLLEQSRGAKPKTVRAHAGRALRFAFERSHVAAPGLHIAIDGLKDNCWAVRQRCNELLYIYMLNHAPAELDALEDGLLEELRAAVAEAVQDPEAEKVRPVARLLAYALCSADTDQLKELCGTSISSEDLQVLAAVTRQPVCPAPAEEAAPSQRLGFRPAAGAMHCVAEKHDVKLSKGARKKAMQKHKQKPVKSQRRKGGETPAQAAAAGGDMDTPKADTAADDRSACSPPPLPGAAAAAECAAPATKGAATQFLGFGLPLSEMGEG